MQGPNLVTEVPSEWEAGVVLAFLAFFIVFLVLSLLAISIHLTSSFIQSRKRREKAVPKPEVAPEVPAAPAAPPEEGVEDLEVVAAIAAIQHFISSRGAPRPPAGVPQVPQFSSNWFSSWLMEVTSREEINPYLRRRGWR